MKAQAHSMGVAETLYHSLIQVHLEPWSENGTFLDGASQLTTDVEEEVMNIWDLWHPEE